MKPAILVTRAVFPEILQLLAQHFEVESNQDDVIFSPQELAAKLQGKQVYSRPPARVLIVTYCGNCLS